MKEFLDIVDENGQPTGETVDREFAHANGIWHRTSHLWLARRKNGKVQILLQKRAKHKSSFPGCYDISSAGHIPAGDSYKISALRELEEELGLVILPEELIDCGLHYKYIDQVFHGERFVDNQVSRVFLLWKDVEAEALSIQPEEIEEVRWFDFEACKQAVANHTIPNCIDLEELAKLEENM